MPPTTQLARSRCGNALRMLARPIPVECGGFGSGVEMVLEHQHSAFDSDADMQWESIRPNGIVFERVIEKIFQQARQTGGRKKTDVRRRAGPEHRDIRFFVADVGQRPMSLEGFELLV